jgi:hypothetical protein
MLLLLSLSLMSVDLAFLPRNTSQRSELREESPSGRYLFLSSMAQANGNGSFTSDMLSGIELWDLRASAPVRFIVAEKLRAGFSPDERSFVSNGVVYDLSGTRGILRTHPTAQFEGYETISNDGTRYAEAWNQNVSLGGRRSIEVPGWTLASIAFDDEGKRLFVPWLDIMQKEAKYSVAVIDYDSGKITQTFTNDKACEASLKRTSGAAQRAASNACSLAGSERVGDLRIGSMRFSVCKQKSRGVAICNFNQTLVRYDATTKRHQFLDYPTVTAPRITIGANGELFYAAEDVHAVTLWELTTMQPKWRTANFAPRGFRERIRLALAADGTRAFLTGPGHDPQVLDFKTLTLTPIAGVVAKRDHGFEFPDGVCGDAQLFDYDEQSPRACKFVPVFGRALGGGLTGERCPASNDLAKRNDFCVRSKDGLSRIAGHLGPVFDAEYDQPRNRLITRSLDGTTRVWDWATKREVSRYARYDGGALIGQHADGRIVYTPDAEPLLTLTNGQNTVALTTLLGRALRSDSATQLTVDEIKNLGTLAAAPFILSAPAPALSVASVEIHVARPHDGTNWELRANGVTLPSSAFTVKHESTDDVISLAVATGDTFVEIREAERAQWPATLRFTYSPIPRANEEEDYHYDQKRRKIAPTLHVVAIGTSKYRDTSLTLDYAASDAAAFAKRMREHDERFARIAVTEVLDADKQGVLAALRPLEKAGTDDMTVIFLAGHGFIGSDDQYYYAAADVDQNAPESTGVPFSELERALGKTRAQQRLLLLDTCHSGEMQVAKTFGITVPAPGQTAQTLLTGIEQTNTRGIRAKTASGAAVEGGETQRIAAARQQRLTEMRAQSGVVVLASSTGSERSFESSQLKRGLFTQALLEVLGRSAAEFTGDPDASLGVAELARYVSDRVAALSGGRQTPTLRVSHPYFDYSFSGLQFERSAANKADKKPSKKR